MNSLILIPIALTVYGIFLAFMFLRTEGKIILKAIVSLLFIILSTAIVYSLPSFFGFPSDASIPKKSNLISVYMDIYGQDKSIYIWVKSPVNNDTPWNIFDYKSNAPRVFSIPFSDENEKLFSNLKEQLENKMHIQISGKFPKNGNGKADKEGNGLLGKSGKGETKDKGSKGPGGDGQFEGDSNRPEINVIDPQIESAK